MLVGDINSAGYHRVCLYHKGHHPDKQRFFRHRLVAEHFIPNPNNYREVNHKDLNRDNNTVENLEWVTREQNELHACINGARPNNYKPFTVWFSDGNIENFNFLSELANRLAVNKRTVKLWITKENHGYLKYDIQNIEYI